MEGKDESLTEEEVKKVFAKQHEAVSNLENLYNPKIDDEVLKGIQRHK